MIRRSPLARLAAAAFALTAAAAVPFVPLTPARAAPQTPAENAAQEIVVTGVGEVIVKPDTAYLSVGVKSSDKQAVIASQKNAAKTTAIIQAIRASGVAADDIRTEDFSLQAAYDYVKDREIFRGYAVSNVVRVTVREVAKAGKVLDAALKAGANTAGGVSFGLADPREAQEQALAKAVADAESKAKLAAKAAGIQSLRLLKLYVGGTAGAEPEDEDGRYKLRVASAIAENRPAPMSAGRRRVVAVVTARYSFSDVPVVTP